MVLRKRIGIGAYPEEIANLRLQILDLDEEISVVWEYIQGLEAETERQIAFDDSLKNEVQRKAFRVKLQLEDREWLEATTNLKQLKRKRKELEIELEQVCNQFSLAKLAERRQIAELEVSA